MIPVYNGATTIPALIDRLRMVLGQLARPYEIIMVNDGSRDASWATIESLALRYPEVVGVDLMRNYGQHNALLAGIRNAQYDVVVTLDDDLQNPPEEIGRLLDKLAEGHDVVYGTPEVEQHGLWRDLASMATKMALQSTMGASTARQVSAFRVFRTELRAAFVNYSTPFLSIDVLLTWATSRFAAFAGHRLIHHTDHNELGGARNPAAARIHEAPADRVR